MCKAISLLRVVHAAVHYRTHSTAPCNDGKLPNDVPLICRRRRCRRCRDSAQHEIQPRRPHQCVQTLVFADSALFTVVIMNTAAGGVFTNTNGVLKIRSVRHKCMHGSRCCECGALIKIRHADLLQAHRRRQIDELWWPRVNLCHSVRLIESNPCNCACDTR